MSAPEFFIDNDAHGFPMIFLRGGVVRNPVLSLDALVRHPAGPALLDLIRAAVEGEVREEWGVRWPEGFTTAPYGEPDARATTERRGEGHLLLRRTVITGAWEEER